MLQNTSNDIHLKSFISTQYGIGFTVNLG